MREKKSFFAALFGGGQSGGCCHMEITEEPEQNAGTAAPVIQVLGPDRPTCQALEDAVRQALAALGTQAVVEPAADCGAVRAPSLTVNGKTVPCGEISADALEKLLGSLL